MEAIAHQIVKLETIENERFGEFKGYLLGINDGL